VSCRPVEFVSYRPTMGSGGGDPLILLPRLYSFCLLDPTSTARTGFILSLPDCWCSSIFIIFRFCKFFELDESCMILIVENLYIVK
jgi:hypothetical protein